MAPPLTTDSPLCRRIVRSILDFLSSVEVGAGINAQDIEIARERLEEAFKLNTSPPAADNVHQNQIKPDSLVQIFSSLREAENVSYDGQGSIPATNSSAGQNAVAANVSKGQGWMGKNHELGFMSEEPKAAGVASSTHVVMGGEGCRICGDCNHHNVDCPFLEYVPPGSCVGAGYSVICGECGYEYLQPTAKWCWSCGEWGGRAVEASTVNEFCRNRQKEFYEEVQSEDESMDLNE